jgi:micrococcal nuclease
MGLWLLERGWQWLWRHRWQWVITVTLWIWCAMTLVVFGQAAGIPATIDYAKSGHTLELLSELSPEVPAHEIRLVGIQAPDRRQQPWGPAAQRYLNQVNGQLVRVEADPLSPDAFGRIWAYVWAGNTLVNAKVLAAGWAFLESDRLAQLKYRQSLVYAQEFARLQGLGIWAPERPLRETPEAFRQAVASP